MRIFLINHQHIQLFGCAFVFPVCLSPYFLPFCRIRKSAIQCNRYRLVMCEKYNCTPKYRQERLHETTEGMKYVQY